MADLHILDNYNTTDWKNYLPPSIDQNNLNHLEAGVKLNRDTINEIIRKLGVKPTDVGANADIYNNEIYQTLIAHKNELAKLNTAKLNVTTYNTNLGNISQLQGGSNLVEAINNRLRRDIDDSSNHTYTFKKLILNNGTSEALNVTGSATISRGLTVAGISSSGKVNVTHADGIETTKLKVNNTATFGSTVTATGKITGNNGIAITGDGSVSETLTVKNLVVTGNISCSGDVGARTVTASSTIYTTGDICTAGALRSKKNYLDLAYDEGIRHRLWVQGANPRIRWRRCINSNCSIGGIGYGCIRLWLLS